MTNQPTLVKLYPATSISVGGTLYRDGDVADVTGQREIGMVGTEPDSRLYHRLDLHWGAEIKYYLPADQGTGWKEVSKADAEHATGGGKKKGK